MFYARRRTPQVRPAALPWLLPPQTPSPPPPFGNIFEGCLLCGSLAFPDIGLSPHFSESLRVRDPRHSPSRCNLSYWKPLLCDYDGDLLLDVSVFANFPLAFAPFGRLFVFFSSDSFPRQGNRPSPSTGPPLVSAAQTLTLSGPPCDSHGLHHVASQTYPACFETPRRDVPYAESFFLFFSNFSLPPQT